MFFFVELIVSSRCYCNRSEAREQGVQEIKRLMDNGLIAVKRICTTTTELRFGPKSKADHFFFSRRSLSRSKAASRISSPLCANRARAADVPPA